MKHPKKPLLAWGDMEPIEKMNNRIARNYYPLPWLWGIFFVGWIPGVVLHELSHYLLAKLLRVEVRSVVLFQFSPAFLGAVYTKEDSDWKMTLLDGAPLFIVLPVFVVFVFFVAIPAMKAGFGWWVPVIWIGTGLLNNSFPD